VIFSPGLWIHEVDCGFEGSMSSESLSFRIGSRRYLPAAQPAIRAFAQLGGLIGKAPGDGFESRKEKAVSSSRRTFLFRMPGAILQTRDMREESDAELDRFTGFGWSQIPPVKPEA